MGDSDGAHGGFPTTAVSQVLAVRSTDPEARARAFAVLATAYVAPVYKYTRRSWRKTEDEAREITQEFFTTALEKGTFASYDPTQARFRTFLRVCLDRFVQNGMRRDRAQKRGGDARFVSFDFDAAERELASAQDDGSSSPDDYFAQQWTRELLRSSLAALEAELVSKKKLVHFHLLTTVDLRDDGTEPPSYAELALSMGLSVSDVTNRLSYARRALRRVLVQKLRELTASDEEFREEARTLFGIEPGSDDP